MSGRYDRPLTPEEIAAVKHEDIDFSDIPELDTEFWEGAVFVEPDHTDQSYSTERQRRVKLWGCDL